MSSEDKLKTSRSRACAAMEASLKSPPYFLRVPGARACSLKGMTNERTARAIMPRSFWDRALNR